MSWLSRKLHKWRDRDACVYANTATDGVTNTRVKLQGLTERQMEVLSASLNVLRYYRIACSSTDDGRGWQQHCQRQYGWIQGPKCGLRDSHFASREVTRCPGGGRCRHRESRRPERASDRTRRCSRWSVDELQSGVCPIDGSVDRLHDSRRWVLRCQQRH